MKTRLIAAAVLVPVLFLVVLVLPKIIAAVIMGLIMAIGAYELLYRTGLVRNLRMVLYSMVMAFAVSLWSHYDSVRAYLLLCLLVFWVVLFAEMMVDHVKVRFETVCLCFSAGFVLPYMLSALVRILNMSIGRYLILIPFVVAFLADAGAYFAGLRFGKHKLAPVVSPNKTIEGVLGGIVGAVAGMLIYTLILYFLNFKVNFGLALLYGVVGCAADVFGDLSFSIIKRQTGIKDYGQLIPGHGGVYDRFDSLVTVAPLMEALLLIVPLAV